MGKHRRKEYTQPAKQWYQNTALVIGIGGIILLVALFFLVNAMFSAPETQPAPTQPTSGTVAQMEGDSQVIRMAVLGYEFSPSSFIVQQGVPVRFIVDGTQASGCTRYVVSRDFGFNKQLQTGENVIEFTPTQKGTFAFSCGMNMVRGTITVV